MIRDFTRLDPDTFVGDVRWVFSPEALFESADEIAEITAETIEETKGAIADRIVDLMINNPSTKEAAQKALGRIGDNSLSDRQWRNLLLKGEGETPAFKDILISDFIEIDDYAAIRAATGTP